MSDEQSLSGPDLGSEGAPPEAIAEGQMLLGHFEGESVVLIRAGGVVSAFGATCSHYGGPRGGGLSEGAWVRSPWHHPAFAARTGAMRRPPALDGVPSYDVIERGGRVFVTGRVVYPQAAPPI